MRFVAIQRLCAARLRDLYIARQFKFYNEQAGGGQQATLVREFLVNAYGPQVECEVWHFEHIVCPR